MSTILITGATGFIGRHLAVALADAGYRLVCAVRSPSREASDGFVQIAVDYTRDFDIETWQPRLKGVDVVINAVGILREQGPQTFEALHELAPQALFRACATRGVKVIQISALGADEDARSRYHLSKKAADDVLLTLGIPAVVVQPSLVYGPGGASAKIFNLMASLPLIPLPGSGNQQIQPVHINDLTEALVALIETDRFLGQRIPVVGPEPLSLRRYLSELRRLMKLGSATFFHVPVTFVSWSARVSQQLGGLLDMETWQMLQRGNTASPDVTRELLGRSPRPVSEFASPSAIRGLRLGALLGWLQPMLRLALAAVWLVAGVVSMGVYPVEESYILLERVGIGGSLAPVALYGAAGLDIAFGLGTLFLRRRRYLWIAQAMLIGVYSVAITFFLPEFWLHPFGPLIKNLPILAIILLLYELENADAQGN